MIALCCHCDTVSVVMSAGNESARPAEGLPAPNSPADAVRNSAQVSFWLLEPVADAAMTYFYAQLFAMDTEIRACSPPALREMELIYPGLQVIPAASDEPAHDHGIMHGTIPELAAKATWADRDVYVSGPDHMIVKTARVLRERGAPDRLIHYDLAPLKPLETRRPARASNPAGACRRTRRSAARRPRPRPCRTAAAPAR